MAIQTEALTALGDVGVATPRLRKTILPHLIRGLQHPTSDMRLAAIDILGTFGEDARKAVPYLRQVKSSDRTEEVRSAAARVLGALEEK